MEDNSKLFVFEKKEVVLIFVFILVVAITAFTLGVRVGKRLSLEASGYTKEDIATVDMKSVEEEDVEAITGSGDQNLSDFEKGLVQSEQSDQSKETPSFADSEVERRLREEMEKLATGQVVSDSDPSKKENAIDVASTGPDALQDNELYRPSQDVQGKYTIQLYANQSQAAAQDFADAFIVKGHDVIINEAVIPGKGTWYRVSIGLFDTTAQAREYLKKESKLFQGEDYIIQKL